MGQQMFGGRLLRASARRSASSLKQWAYTPEELVKKPGYRFGREEREEDLAEAKRLWEAGGGPDLGEVELSGRGHPGLRYVKNHAPQLQRTSGQEALGYEASRPGSTPPATPSWPRPRYEKTLASSA